MLLEAGYRRLEAGNHREDIGAFDFQRTVNLDIRRKVAGESSPIIETAYGCMRLGVRNTVDTIIVEAFSPDSRAGGINKTVTGDSGKSSATLPMDTFCSVGLSPDAWATRVVVTTNTCKVSAAQAMHTFSGARLTPDTWAVVVVIAGTRSHGPVSYSVNTLIRFTLTPHAGSGAAISFDPCVVLTYADDASA